MEKNSPALRLTRVAAVAAVYFALTMAVAPLSFGAVQIRVSELLVLLCFFNRDYCVALVAGCLLANLFSPFGWYDVVFGTLHTAVSAVCVAKSKNLLVASVWPVLFSVIISLEIYFLADAPLLLTALTVAAGEAAAVCALGCPAFYALARNKGFMKIIGSKK